MFFFLINTSKCIIAAVVYGLIQRKGEICFTIVCDADDIMIENNSLVEENEEQRSSIGIWIM